jgi:Cys-tRNA(Pro) deacylase
LSKDIPQTSAVRWLLARKIKLVPHDYSFKEHGGTGHAARCLEVEEHAVIKTLVMTSEEGNPFLVLMHGDSEVSTKQLARALGKKKVTPCDVPTAERVTGYQVGGISPFGIRRELPVYVQATILGLPRIYINGGKRGFLVEIDPAVLGSHLAVTLVQAALS